MPTDADTEAGRGEGRDGARQPAEWTGEELAEQLEKLSYYRSEKRQRYLREAARRLRESDPGGEPVVAEDIEVLESYETMHGNWFARIRYDDVVADGLHKHRGVAFILATCELWEAMAGRAPAAPTDEAPETCPHGKRFPVEGCPDCYDQAVSPPVEEGERGELPKVERCPSCGWVLPRHEEGCPDDREEGGDEDYWSCPVCGGRFPQEMVDRAAADAGIPCPLCKRQVKVAERIEMETLLRDYFEALDEYRSITRPGRAGSGFAEASKRVTSAEDRLRETLSGLRSTPQGAFDGD